MLKIRRPLGRLIFNMGIAMPGKTVFLIETGPCCIEVITIVMTGHKFCQFRIIKYSPYFQRLAIIMMDYLEGVGNLGPCITKRYIFLPILLCMFNCRHCKLHFSSMKLHMAVAFKTCHLFVVGARPFPAKQNVKYECFHCAFQISHALAYGVYAPTLRWPRQIMSWWRHQMETFSA